MAVYACHVTMHLMKGIVSDGRRLTGLGNHDEKERNGRRGGWEEGMAVEGRDRTVPLTSGFLYGKIGEKREDLSDEEKKRKRKYL